MTERYLTPAGARKLATWLRYCRENGWPASALPKLSALWEEFHDDDGRLRTTDEATVARND